MNKYIPADKLLAEIERRRLSNRYIDTEGYEKELLEIITSLQQEQPSLPSDLDEAAKKAKAEYVYNEGGPFPGTTGVSFITGFKAGAEWMAGRGVSMPGKVGIYGVDVESITEELQKAGFKLGEEVVLQIRKKQQPYGRMAKLSGRNE